MVQNVVTRKPVLARAARGETSPSPIFSARTAHTLKAIPSEDATPTDMTLTVTSLTFPLDSARPEILFAHASQLQVLPRSRATSPAHTRLLAPKCPPSPALQRFRQRYSKERHGDAGSYVLETVLQHTSTEPIPDELREGIVP